VGKVRDEKARERKEGDEQKLREKNKDIVTAHIRTEMH